MPDPNPETLFDTFWPVQERHMPPSCEALEARYYEEREARWRRETWYARPSYAIPSLWHAAVVDVALLLGEKPPTLADCELPEPPFGSRVRFS